MRYNIVKNILKKELKDIFRDKKTIFAMIILPILLYPLLMVGGAQIGAMLTKEMSETTYKIAVEHTVPEEVVDLIEEEEQLESIELADGKKGIEDETISAYLSRDLEKANGFQIYYNGSSDQSNQAMRLLEDILVDYKSMLVATKIESMGMEVESVLQPITYTTQNLAKNEEMAGYFLAMVLPFILLISITSGAVYPAIDVMAGEKERGTIETLLTLPVSNLELIIGKYMAVATVALMSALLNLLSIGASIGLMIGSLGMAMGEEMPTFALGQFAVPLMITVITIFLFTLVVVAISMSICALAKSFKEAQNYITPLLLVVMIPSYVTMIPTIELSPMTASIPIVNIALLMKSVLMFKYDFGLMAMVLISNLALVIIAIFILIKLFDSEAVLFGSGKEFSILQRRYNIKKGTLPTPSDAFMIYGVALLAMIYIAQFIQLKLGFWGLALTQVLIAGIALGFGYYMKTDWKKAFSIKVPKLRQILGAVVLWLGTWFIANALGNLLIPLIPNSEENLQALAELMFHDSMWMNLLVVACMPAVCEELLFRGIIYKGMENGKHGRRAVVVTAILFGIMHMDMVKIPVTAVLGLALGYVVYKTGSIFLAMLMHLINNGLAVVIDHLQVQPPEWMQQMSVGMMLIIGCGIALVGILLLQSKQKQKKNETT
ncbi:MAG: ABC transporter permease subunit/CPBP intramembrane protease [Cellulosilyticaceae bacterium]